LTWPAIAPVFRVRDRFRPISSRHFRRQATEQKSKEHSRMDYQQIKLEVDDLGIATVTLDRPPVNALNRQSRDEITHVFDTSAIATISASRS
jgi:hypothetical protein